MNGIKKTLVSVATAATILFGSLIVAPVATAETAQAWTATQCKYVWYNGYRIDTVCYFDYNWWEESWMGGSNRDGWYRTGWTYA